MCLYSTFKTHLIISTINVSVQEISDDLIYNMNKRPPFNFAVYDSKSMKFHLYRRTINDVVLMEECTEKIEDYFYDYENEVFRQRRELRLSVRHKGNSSYSITFNNKTFDTQFAANVTSSYDIDHGDKTVCSVAGERLPCTMHAYKSLKKFNLIGSITEQKYHPKLYFKCNNQLQPVLRNCREGTFDVESRRCKITQVPLCRDMPDNTRIYRDENSYIQCDNNREMVIYCPYGVFDDGNNVNCYDDGCLDLDNGTYFYESNEHIKTDVLKEEFYQSTAIRCGKGKIIEKLDCDNTLIELIYEISELQLTKVMYVPSQYASITNSKLSCVNFTYDKLNEIRVDSFKFYSSLSSLRIQLSELSYKIYQKLDTKNQREALVAFYGDSRTYWNISNETAIKIKKEHNIIIYKNECFFMKYPEKYSYVEHLIIEKLKTTNKMNLSVAHMLLTHKSDLIIVAHVGHIILDLAITDDTVVGSYINRFTVDDFSFDFSYNMLIDKYPNVRFMYYTTHELYNLPNNNSKEITIR